MERAGLLDLVGGMIPSHYPVTEMDQARDLRDVCDRVRGRNVSLSLSLFGFIDPEVAKVQALEIINLTREMRDPPDPPLEAPL